LPTTQNLRSASRRGRSRSKSKAEGELTLDLKSGEEQKLRAGLLSLYVGVSLLAMLLIVPTLCVGMPPGTLCVPLSTPGLSLAQG
jgi:hypothetical protein